ncbi:tripartite tricarboxylate transporter substrate binding protein [Falsiroseomonas sp. HW251]|uniref:tripartite tricarboxylate transporter substrate binding protein n=1 Tax=Falsiroseomonas sp. HW251 TaxID=3390998 RepID=UPI003D31138A
MVADAARPLRDQPRRAERAEQPHDGRLGQRRRAVQLLHRGVLLPVEFAQQRQRAQDGLDEQVARGMVSARSDTVSTSLPICASPTLMMVRADSPFPDLAAMLGRARAQPADVSFSSSGIGTTVHLAGELLRARAGVDLLHVPYRGSAPSATALQSGEVDASFLSPIEVLPQIRAGRLRALANCAPTRTLLPEVPAVAEIVPSYDGVQLLFGLFGPRDLPADAVATLMRELAPLLRGSLLSERLAEVGADMLLDGPAVLAARLRAEVPLWKSVAEAAACHANDGDPCPARRPLGGHAFPPLHPRHADPALGLAPSARGCDGRAVFRDDGHA